MCKLFPNYPTSQFDLRIERTPFSTWTEVLSIVGLYYVVIFGGQAPMSNRKSWNLGLLVPAHNLLLSVTSGLLLLLYLEEILPTIAHNGLLYAMCTHAGGWTRRLVVLYYVSSSRADSTQ
jgi:fatty acid elongase 3